MRSATRILMAWVVMNALVVTMAGHRVDSSFGSIQLSGCKDCDPQTRLEYNCLYDKNADGDITGCNSDACEEWRFYWAECEEDGSDETNNCLMHMDFDELWYEKYELVREGELNCTYTDPAVPRNLPTDDDCYSTGFSSSGEVPWSDPCGLSGSCGTMQKAGSRAYWNGRLVCGS